MKRFARLAVLILALLILTACSAPQTLPLPAAVPAATPAPTPEPTPQPTPEPTPAPTPDPGQFGEKFADKFTGGERIVTETGYKSRDVSVEVTCVSVPDLTYYVADIYVRDIEQLRTAFSRGEYDGNNESVLDMAGDAGAIVAINGDYYKYNKGIVIRNGELYRDKAGRFDMCVIYEDGTMETYSPEETDLDAILSREPWQSWSFGPMLLSDGQPMSEFNSGVTVRNPRAAIGYYEPGHYCFVLVDGRAGSYSRGVEMAQLSQIFYELGCSEAYNLDGGQTAVMTLHDAVINRPFRGGRDISDIIYIGETTLPDADLAEAAETVDDVSNPG